MPALKKLLVSLLLGLTLISSSLFPLFASNTLAQSSSTQPKSKWYNQNFPDWFKKVYDSPDSDVFGERYTSAQVQWIIYGLFAFALNTITGDPKLTSCIMSNKNIAQCKVEQFFTSLFDEIKSKIPGASDSGNSVLGYIFLEDRPLSGITYFRNIGRNWHLVPEVKAQTGFGFNALDPILPLWRASRNVAYGVLVLAILVMSFMIMFRVKINPQTVITVQSSIPKIVAALILITFSYAIAGLAIDLMYVVIGFFALILSTAYGSLAPGLQNIPFINSSVTNLFGYMTTGLMNTGILGGLFFYFLLFGVAVIFALLGTTGILGTLAITTAASAAVGITYLTGIGGIFLIIAILIIIASLFIMAFRIAFMLFKAFAFVVLLVTFAPLQIAAGVVVPSLGFSQWVRSLASNLAVFPVTGAFFSLAFFFLAVAMQLSLRNLLSGPLQFLGGNTLVFTNPGWPPLLGTGGGSGTQGIAFLGVSFVLVAMLPRVTEFIQGLISGRPYAYGTAIGEAFGPARGLGTLALTPETSAIEALARKNQRSVWEQLQLLPLAERARYLGAAGLNRVLGGGGKH